MDERLRLIVELQNKASAELKKLARDTGSIRQTPGMISAANWFEKLESASSASSKAIRPLVGGLNLVGVSGLAAGLSVAGLISQFRDLAKALPALQELSRQSGISKTELARLQYAASKLHLDPSKMTDAIGAWSAQMVQFQRATGEVYFEMQNGSASLAQKIVKEYGTDPVAALKDQLRWLAAIPEAQMRAGKSAQEAAQIQKYWVGKTLGDEGMAQFFGKGMEGINAALDEATKRVAPVTDDLERAAEKFDDSITNFNQTWRNFEVDVGPKFLDPLSAALDKLDGALNLAAKYPGDAAAVAGTISAAVVALRWQRRIMAGSKIVGGQGLSAAAGELTGAAREQVGAAEALKGAAASLGSRGAPGGAAPPEEKEGKGGGTIIEKAMGALAVFTLAQQAQEDHALEAPKSFSARGFLNFLDPNFGDLFLGKETGTSPAAAGAVPPHPDDDRLSRAGVSAAPVTLPVPVPTAFHPSDDDRQTRARASDAPDRSLDNFVLGALDKPVTHLVGTLKTAAAALDGGPVHQAAFHPAMLGGAALGSDPVALLAAGTKAGFLAAFRELQGSAAGDGAGGGFMPTSFGGGGMGGGYSAAAAGHAGAANMRYGRGGRTPGGTGAGDNGLGRFDAGAPGANGYGLINAPYRGALDQPGEGGTLSPRALFDYLKAHGATDNEATMLTGAAGSESSFNPRAVHDHGNGYGLWGHNLHRIDMRGMDWQHQADAALAEAKTKYADWVNGAKTPEELADAEAHYEAPRGFTSRNPRGADNYTGRLNTLRRFAHGFGTMGFDPEKPGAASPVAAGPDGIAGHIRGNLQIGDETYAYGSGGVRGSAHVPYGDYPINPDSGNPWGQAHNAMDVNGNGSIWDASLGRMRTGIEMHVAHSANMITEGCLAFLKDQYPQLKSRVKEMIAKTGHAYLHVGEKGASITPYPKLQDQPKPEIAPMPEIKPEPRQGNGRDVVARAQVDPVRIDLHHHESGRTRIAAKAGRGVQLSIRTAPMPVQTV